MMMTAMEIRRLLWFTAMVLLVVLFIQYSEHPYGFPLSSLLSLGKSHATSQGNRPFNGSSGVSNHLNDDNYSSGGFTVINQNPKVEKVAGNKSLELHTSYNAESNYSSLDNLHSATNGSVSIQSPTPSTSAIGKESANVSDFSSFFNSSSLRRFEGQPDVVLPISAMNDMLHQSRLSYESAKPKWSEQADRELLNTRKLIESAQIMETNRHIDVNVYRNYSEFVRSYELMEKTLKIYVYTEGERPIFHQPKLVGIYASEGWFMKQMEENKHFVTTDPAKAHLFYLPFSSRLLEATLYAPNTHSYDNLVEHLSRYLRNITRKYQFWNRTDGADHFLVACHDWFGSEGSARGPSPSAVGELLELLPRRERIVTCWLGDGLGTASSGAFLGRRTVDSELAPAETSRIMMNCIRALCNADADGEFHFGKDVSLPETFIRYAKNPLRDLGGKPPSQRSILVFFAGKMHGYLRPILLKYWENKDPNMKIFSKIHETKGQKSIYIQYMKDSRYCIHAKGYGPHTPRVMEAIFYECVPVIISDNYVPPFFETLNWESFAVFVMEKDIPNLKSILLSISERRYLEMHERVRQVQKHFLWHVEPVKYDVFHMVLHSIWYTRVFQMTSLLVD
ncbi:hypothetical protein OROGR_005910 [Orobanche gracilis]